MSSSTKPGRPFLTAEWRHLVMLNYAVDRRVLGELLPAGTELDDFRGETFVSMVGFLFLKTRLLGVPLPGYGMFEEVNLRFYVRRRGPDGWRRGVVFVREIVPRVAVAAVARLVYNERYTAMRMRNRIEADPPLVEYEWRHRGRWNWMIARGDGHSAIPPEGSEESFITEHYWGYTRQRDGGTLEYRVDHPQWEVMRASVAALECDAAALYGQEFAEYLSADPSSAFIADGSQIQVYPGRRIPV
jgi:uncharacterized protein YqjF (DUF2071 family)